MQPDIHVNNWQDFASWVGHFFSGVTLVGALSGFFPPFAALVAIIWYSIQIYESKTVQRWVSTRRARRIVAAQKLIEKLEAQSRIVEATARYDAQMSINKAVDELHKTAATAEVVKTMTDSH